MAASQKPIWLEWTVFLLIHLMMAVTRRLPLSWARGFGRSVGALLYYLNSRWRRVAVRNLELAYPSWTPTERRTVAKQSVQSTAELMAEMGRLWVHPWSDIMPLIEVEGSACISKPLASGQGVIVLGPHLGNWELLGLHVATLGDLVALYEPLALKKLDQLVFEGRQRTGGKLVPTTARGIAELVRAVRGGGITGILPDQVPREASGGLDVPFFGVECFTATLAYNLIKRSGAAAVMGTVLRTPKGFRAVYREAEPEVYSDDPQQALAAINRGVEKLIMGNERQYQWQYKRFRVQPPGQADHYNWSVRPLLDEGGAPR